MDASSTTCPWSLQYLSSKFITLHTEKFPASSLEELSQPCLEKLVDLFSMYDLLNYEKFLEKRGIDAKAAMYRCQRRLFDCIEAYPIKATTCPHLLQTFPCDGFEWGLSRMLYRRVIVKIVEEFSNYPQELQTSFPLCIQGNILHLQPPLLDLFCPANCTLVERNSIREKVSWNEEMMINMIVLSARKIVFVTVDFRVCKFLLHEKFDYILKIMCESVRVLSLLLKGYLQLIKLIRNFKIYGEKLEKISLYVIRMHDLLYFDEILAVCSGVSSYKTTVEGKIAKEVLKDAIAADRSEKPEVCELDRFWPRPTTMEVDLNDGPSSESDSESTFDLMDDAVLFGNPCPPSRFDAASGLTKADLKFTNLVAKELYLSVLNHHLRSWLALQELHLGVPNFEPLSVQGLCAVLQRPQFKVLTLSSADYHPAELEEILVTVATCRKSNPLEKLMFISLQEKAVDMNDILINEHLNGKNPEEVVEYMKKFESPRLTELPGFQGTKLFELYQCPTGIKTEALVRQFVLKDTAITSLCLRTSMTRLAVESLVISLAAENRQLVQLILEDWHVLSKTSCDALVSLLQASSDSVNFLNLKGCLTDRTMYNIKDITDAVANCKNLKAVDFSENVMGEHSVPFVKSIISQTSVGEICLRKNNMSKNLVVDVLREVAAIIRTRRHGLETLDLKGNQFFEADRQIHLALTEQIARHVLVTLVPESR